MNRVRAAMILTVAVSVGAVIAVAARCSAENSDQPPSFSPTVPNEYRVGPSMGFHDSRGVPPSPWTFVSGANGNAVGVLIDPDQRQDNPHRMQLQLCPSPTTDADAVDMNKCVNHLVAAGDSVTDFGVNVNILKLWWMPNDKYDALDAVITTTA